MDSNDDASKLEDAMAQLEGKASTVISNIIKTQNIKVLPDADRKTLREFTALQSVRTPEFVNWRHEMMQSESDALVESMEITDWRIKINPKLVHLTAMSDSIGDILTYLSQMGICLLKNDTDMPLWTSDNPVVRHNSLTNKLGAGSPGVQFYLPLTHNLLLVFYDGTYADLLDDAGECDNYEDLWMRANISSGTDRMDKTDVLHANRLQIKFSTRFVYANKPDFHMMGEFLEADGGYKERHISHGPGGDDTVGNTKNNLDRTDMVNLTLQNALWWYREAKQEKDMHRAFMHLCKSLEMLIPLCWDEDIGGKWFDDRMRALTDIPKLSLDRFRQIYDSIRHSGYPDQHLDGVQMTKHVEDLIYIVTKAILGRREELQASDSFS